MGAFGVGVFESDVRGDVEELLEEGGKPAVVKCGSPQIVEGLRLRGVRDGRRGGLLVIDR